MRIEEIKVGQWLKFKAGTCFGNEKDHLGLFVAISEDLAVCVAVNATSNVEGVKNFARRRRIDADETVVVVEPGTQEAAFHFGKETAFDCNRPVIVKNGDLEEWLRRRMVELADYNVEVDEGLVRKIKWGIVRSPLVPERRKRLIDLDEEK